MPATSQRLERLLRLIMLVQSGVPTFVDDLRQALGISRRTLFRDIRALQSSGVPCRYDRARGYVIDDSFYMPAPQLDARETLALLAASRAVQQHMAMPMRMAALSAIAKTLVTAPQWAELFGHAAAAAAAQRSADAAAELNEKLLVLLQSTEALEGSDLGTHTPSAPFGRAG